MVAFAFTCNSDWSLFLAVMYLKNLTVLGFKSFADKTSLNFQPGITAIVGPNGCGKSNVADAIRWVLGEQSAKALRGAEMADVIFNGTDSRRALGMAEVSLTIGGVDQEHLKAAGVDLTFNEVTVTRRVFRDGGSEYFVNKVPCRLRDVQQLFMGTGVGRASYSIMAQGHITQILSSKPDDRRLVFEEAAGITKFKSQKKESLRKLEYTDQNLLRVADLIREVKRQIGSLQRQAGKAKRYKQLMVDLQHLETQLARHQYDVLKGEIGVREKALEEANAQMELTTQQIVQAEEQVALVRAGITALEAEVHAAQQQGLELKSQMERNENRAHFNEQRLKELNDQSQVATSDITQAEERREITTHELGALTERVKVSSAALEAQRVDLRVKLDALTQLEARLRAVQEESRKMQSEAFTTAQHISRTKNEINTLDLQRQGSVTRLEKLQAEQVQTAEENLRLEVRLAEFAQQVESEKLGVVARRGTVEERQVRLRELQHAVQQASQEADLLLRQQAEKRSRLNVLEQLEQAHEGFSAAAQTVLKQTQAVLGSLADKIRVPDTHVVAVEAALGQALQSALTARDESALKILNDLSAQKKGRASIVSLELCSLVGEGGRGGAQATPEGAIAAMSVIHAESVVAGLLVGLIGQTLIVPDLATATQIWRAHPGGYDFVTASGDLLSRSGVYTGGFANGNGNGRGPSSILGRKNQIEELKAQIAALQEQVGEASRRKGALQSEQTELQLSLQQAQTELRSHEVAVAAREGEFRALQNSTRVLKQKAQSIVVEMESIKAQDVQSFERRERLIETFTQAEEKEKGLQARLAEANGQIETFRHERDLANAALTEVKVAVAAEEQLNNSLRNQVRPLEQRIRELGQRIEQRKMEMSSFEGRRSQAMSEIQDARQKNETLAHQREQVSVRITTLTHERDQQQKNLEGREEGLRGLRGALAAAQQRKGLLEVELAQRRMGVQNLVERIQQKYQILLEDVRSECITITVADSGPTQVEVLSPEEMAARGVGTDWAAVGEQVLSLQKRVEEIGPVNLVAIEEYEETEQRYQFLSAQHDDLVKAKEQLMEIINRINAETKDLFSTTFTKIRDNFRQMFTEIFGGGQADLVLVDEGDALESGIEIVARPPGKQMRNITLMSGGEQTMTAVALLFAIYQVKPSPFCVLDELDAPLDESNINRFIRVLQRFLAHSQFVIITHNKRTIGIADVLYGVTMQEQGVSKIVSVKFHKADEPAGGERGGVPLVPPATVPAAVVEEDRKRPPGENLEIVMAK